MAARRPGPMDDMRRNAPRTGPPVPNMGGINAVPRPPQRYSLPTQPMPADAAAPGPAPTAPITPGGGAGRVGQDARGTFPLPPQMTVSPQTGQPTFVPGNVPLPPGAMPRQVPGPGTTPGAAPAEGTQPPAGEGQPTQPTQPQPAQQPQPPQGPQGQPATTETALGQQQQGTATPGVDKGYSSTSTLDYVPETFELDGLQPGQGVTTPEGDIYRDRDTGKLKMRLNDQGKASYQKARTEKIKRFGRYPGADDPNAPAPPVNPRGPDFNPFAPDGSGWIE